MTEWESADGANNREKISRARQAAEDLFKPAPHSPPELAPASGASAGRQQERRQPRVFAIPPRAAPNAEAEAPAEPKPMRRDRVSRQVSGRVPASQLGRIRTLANYGMTRAQVAELYGVTIEEVDRILKGAAHPTKSR